MITITHSIAPGPVTPEMRERLRKALVKAVRTTEPEKETPACTTPSESHRLLGEALQSPACCDRFNAGIRRGSQNECWEWQGAATPKGYGVMCSGLSRRNVYTHRFAYAKAFGLPAEGLFVCHRCDNPRCCNPAHLFIGTALDNAQDMVSKGRWRGNKLQPDQRIREQRKRHRAEVLQQAGAENGWASASEIARELGLTPQAVSKNARDGKYSWRLIAGQKRISIAEAMAYHKTKTPAGTGVSGPHENRANHNTTSPGAALQLACSE